MRNNIKYSRFGFILLFLFSIAFGAVSCQDDFDPGQTAVGQMSGKWYVREYVKSGNSYSPVSSSNYFKIRTFNTSKNSEKEMYIDDIDGGVFNLHILFVDLGNMTFKSVDGETGDVFSNGHVHTQMGRSKTGVVTDSIYFELKSGATTKIYGGHMFTGFLEDMF